MINFIIRKSIPKDIVLKNIYYDLYSKFTFFQQIAISEELSAPAVINEDNDDSSISSASVILKKGRRHVIESDSSSDAGEQDWVNYGSLKQDYKYCLIDFWFSPQSTLIDSNKIVNY